jgi:hypothetical protein
MMVGSLLLKNKDSTFVSDLRFRYRNNILVGDYFYF